MTPPIDIRPCDLKIVQDILHKYLPQEAQVWVFGSRATWTTKDSSDLDLAIDTGRPLTQNEDMSLHDAFEESDLPYKVDVVDMQTVSDHFKKIIEKDRMALHLHEKENWAIKKLSDICRSITYGLTATTEHKETGCRFLRITDISGRHFNWQNVPWVTASQEEQKKYKLNHGDIVIARTGATTGESLYIKDPPCSVFASYLVRYKIADTCDARYVSYFLTSKEWRSYIKSVIGDKSAQPNASAATMAAVSLPVPPLPQQKAIAHILGTLDDKIELNHQMNQTLQDIAQAIFKSWFIDFDPVHAKAEGRSTGLPPELNDLFPDQFVDSELGKIPMEWTIQRLGEFCTNVKINIKPSTQTNNMPYVPIECISRKSLSLYETKNGIEAKSGLIRFESGDILFGAMRSYFHKVCVAPFNGITRDTCLILKAKEPRLYGFLVLMLFHEKTIEFATQHSTGSTIPRIKWSKQLENMLIVVPHLSLASKFNDFIYPIIQKFCASFFEHNALTNIRDALLPKLLSGELSIPDAEQFLKDREL